MRATALVMLVGSMGLVLPAQAEVGKPPKPPKPSVTKLTPATGSAAGGVVVKVKGANLTGAKKVLFGSVPGTQLKVKNTKKLTVVAPAQAAGVVDVRVVTKGGKSKKVAQDHFTYVSSPPPTQPAPSVTSVSPGTGPTAGGTQVTLVGTGFTGVTAVTFGGVPGTAVNAASATQLTVTSPAHAACPVEVRVITAAGTSAASVAARFDYVTTLAATPGISQPAPLPCDASPAASTTVTDVACPAVGSCQAVGYFGTTTRGRRPLVETLAGGTWTPAELPLPTGASPSAANADLAAISCPTTTFCAAVGEYDDTSAHRLALFETWNGTAWTATGLDLPAPASASAVPFMSAVACSGAGSCTAVGRYSQASTNHAVIATLAAGAWTFALAPLPPSSTAALLQDVACSGATCVAVGTVTPTGAQPRPLIETGSGSGWTPLAPDLPANKAATPAGLLSGVSCATGTTCVAVGSYDTSGGTTQMLIETLNSGTWSPGSVAPPAGAATNPRAILWDVSCPSVVFCAASGYYLTTAAFDSSRAMVLTLGSGGPTVSEVTLPNGHPTAPQAAATHIVCPSYGSCAGTGGYQQATGRTVGLLARVSGSVQPGAAATSPAGATSLYLNALATDTLTTAVAVGGYSSPSGGGGVLLTGVPVGPPPPA